jgi:hypothetical protein
MNECGRLPTWRLFSASKEQNAPGGFARVEYVCGRITPRVLQGLDDSILNWEWVFFWVSFEEVAR